jgi:segregation and condensation protein A
MTTPAQTAIATLINMAEQGEINPWDVQVIDVIDRFLEELGLSRDLDSNYSQISLPRSGQAFLWASMLVRFKADTLERWETHREEEVILEPELEEETGYHRRLPLDLENHIRRRSSAPPVQKRRVTLQELIEQLEQMATELEEPVPTPVTKRTPSQSRREAMRVIAQLAHQENLTELANQLENFLKINLPQLTPDKTNLELEELLHWWTQAKSEPVSSPTSERVGVFWALLLLSSQSKVELSQTEFYQDLKIQMIS